MGSIVDAYALVRETIYRSAIMLDRQDWDGWLNHCDDAFQYAIRLLEPGNQTGHDLSGARPEGSREHGQASAQAQPRITRR